MLRTLLVVGLLLPFAVTARADTLLLQDGRAIVGPRVEPTSDGVIVHFEHGKVHVPASQVLARFDAGPPDERVQLRAHLRHRPWRNRRIEDVPPFRFETNQSPQVFARCRDHVLAYFAALCRELGVEPPERGGPRVCLYANAKDFRQIAGASAGSFAYHARLTNEINGFNDPMRRGTCLRGLQYALASYGVGLAFPDLSHHHPLHGALVAYYAAAAPKPEDPAGFVFGLVDGMQSELLRGELGPGQHARLDRVTKGSRTQRAAWSWAVVHHVLGDPGRRVSILTRLKAVEGEGAWGLDALLGLETPEARAAWEQQLEQHVRSLAPTTAVDLVAAGRVAEHDHEVIRARSLYEQALALSPDDMECRAALARFLDAHGAPAEAVRALRAVLDLDPLDVDARHSLGWALDRASPEGDREVRLALEIWAAFAKP